MLFLTLAICATISRLALAFPANSSTRGLELIKRAEPVIDDEWNDVQRRQIEQGIKDACFLAQAGYAAVLQEADRGNTVYPRYFPVGDQDDENKSRLNNVRTIFGNIALVGARITPGVCSPDLSDFTIRKDFENPDNENEKSCTKPNVMASTRNGGSDGDPPPIMVLCDPALAHGNIGPSLVPGIPSPVVIKGAPPPVTCDDVNAGGLRATWRMDTLGATILHEYTHYGVLTDASIPGGTLDTLDGDNDDSLTRKTSFYGPVDVQKPLIANKFAPDIADSYAWFATEVLWTEQCGKTYGAARPGDDEDPAFGGGPGQDPDSDSGDDSDSV